MTLTTKESVLSAIENSAEPLTVREISNILAVRGLFVCLPTIRKALAELVSLKRIAMCSRIAEDYRSRVAYELLRPSEREPERFVPLKGWRCSIIPVREGNRPAPDPYAEFRGQRHVTVGNAEFGNA